MKAKIIVNKKDVEKHGLEEKLFQLAKVIESEPNHWVFVPESNLQTFTHTLEEKRISYGVESDFDFFRERAR